MGPTGSMGSPPTPLQLTFFRIAKATVDTYALVGRGCLEYTVNVYVIALATGGIGGEDHLMPFAVVHVRQYFGIGIGRSGGFGTAVRVFVTQRIGLFREQIVRLVGVHESVHVASIEQNGTQRTILFKLHVYLIAYRSRFEGIAVTKEHFAVVIGEILTVVSEPYGPSPGSG